MEREIIERIRTSVAAGDRAVERMKLEMAHDHYMDALYGLGLLVAYRETGRLMPLRELIPYLRARHPELSEVVDRYSVVSPTPEEVSSLRDELERLVGMMSLPSSDG